MIIYIRHGDDNENKPSYIHDTHITKQGKRNSKRIAIKLIKKYGIPKTIYVGPLLRTRETLSSMMKIISKLKPTEKPQIIIESSLSRYFTSSEQKVFSVSDRSLYRGVPIYETWDDFKERVKKHWDNISHHRSEKDIIWCVTHTLVIKEISYATGIKIKDHLSFLDKLVVK